MRRKRKRDCFLRLLCLFAAGSVSPILRTSQYRHPVYLLETFIDPEQFSGTCYRAANWRFVGLTTGRGKDDQTMKANRSLKQLWVLPLAKDFRTQLRGGNG